MSSDFEIVCAESDLSEGQIKLVEANQRLVILFRNEGEVYCIDDVCTHDGGTLSDGAVQGCQIICPRHGAKFDLCTGKALTMPATQDTAKHEVKIIDGQIAVKVEDE